MHNNHYYQSLIAVWISCVYSIIEDDIREGVVHITTFTTIVPLRH